MEGNARLGSVHSVVRAAQHPRKLRTIDKPLLPEFTSLQGKYATKPYFLKEAMQSLCVCVCVCNPTSKALDHWCRAMLFICFFPL